MQLPFSYQNNNSHNSSSANLLSHVLSTQITNSETTCKHLTSEARSLQLEMDAPPLAGPGLMPNTWSTISGPFYTSCSSRLSMSPSMPGAQLQAPASTSCQPILFPSPQFSSPHNHQMHVAPPSSQWQHTIPNSMPWSVPNQQNGLQFTASLPDVISSVRSVYSAELGKHQKRKADITSGGPRQKMYISEDKMAAKMRNLHISSDTPSRGWNVWDAHKNASLDEVMQELDNRLNVNDDEDISDTEPESNGRGAKLHISPELQAQFKKTNTDIVSKAVLEELNKPCLEVVLWKPPENFVCNVIKDVQALSKTNSKTNLECTKTCSRNGSAQNNSYMEESTEDISLPARSAASWRIPLRSVDTSADMVPQEDDLLDLMDMEDDDL